jgi:tetratricopeptide (TPR) repeat protein
MRVPNHRVQALWRSATDAKREGRQSISALILAIAVSTTIYGAQATGAGGQLAARTDFAEAEQALDRGDLASAFADVEKGLRGAPRSVTGLNLLGIVLAQQGKNEQALEAFNAALKVNPRSVVTHNDLGRLYMVLKEPQLAEAQFRAALREAPTDHDANYNLGVLLLAQGRALDAITCFRRLQPPDAGTLFNLTRAYLSSGETQEGLRSATLLSEREKGDVRVHFSLGVVLAAQKQYQPAERELEAADALAPGTFEILYNLGEAYLRDGRAGEADLTLRRSVKLRPKSAEALYLLAQAETAEGKDVDSLDALVRAHHFAPKNTDVIFLMARVSMKQHYFEDAIPLLEDGLKIAPQRADLHAALGRCYFTAGQPAKALQEFQTLVKLQPTASSYAFMGFYYLNLSRYDEARKYFLMGLTKDPRSAVCLYNMGFIADRKGHYAQAETWLKKALAADPNDNNALFTLASVKMSERKYAEAIPLLRKCVRLDRDPAPDYYKLMTAERHLHQIDAAEKDFKIFQTLAKNPPSEPHPFEDVFEYLNKREGMSSQERSEADLGQLLAEVKLHPEEPRNLYTLAQDYLELGKPEEAQKIIVRLDALSEGDPRTAAGVGVLLARYRLYPEAIDHFQMSLKSDPTSDGVKYDLADAYFRIRRYNDALAALEQISPAGQKDASVLSLVADTDAHAGRFAEAIQIYTAAIRESPDDDQKYLSLALTQMRADELAGARAALLNGLARIPDSGKLFWGMGVMFAAEGQPQRAVEYLRKSVDLLPEWPGSYAALGFLYFQIRQIDKARDTLNQISQNGLQAAFNVARIEQVLAAASKESPRAQPIPFSTEDRQQFLQLALTLADTTL